MNVHITEEYFTGKAEYYVVQYYGYICVGTQYPYLFMFTV
jgi:hypothetical protein